jgi:hypothetical protein
MTLGRGVGGATAGSTSDYMGKGFLQAFPLLSPAKPESCGSWIWLVRRPSPTPTGLLG